MILFTVLVTLVSVFAISAIIAAAFGGATFILMFGDLLVCGLFMVLILKAFTKKGKH